jgi:hypothetical protein
MRRTGIFVAMLGLAACCVRPPLITPSSGTSCRVVNAYTIDKDFTAQETDEITHDMSAWAKVTGECWWPSDAKHPPAVRIHVGHRQDFIVIFLTDWPLGALAIGAYTHGQIWLLPSSDPMQGDAFEASAAHELGHYLGLDHSTEGLMQPAGGTLENGEIPWVTVREYWASRRP